ncbi:MAG TPA: carboxypeptidase-like regulatory domain-containing protein [Thermoanaerobaculia bacterium]
MKFSSQHLLLLMTIAVTSAAAAAETFSSVRGRIVMVDTAFPFSNATVTLSGPALGKPLTVTADAEGRFLFIVVPPGPGTYRLTVSDPESRQYAIADIGGVSASEPIYVEGTFSLRLCSTLSLLVRRRSPTQRYTFPAPLPPQYLMSCF